MIPGKGPWAPIKFLLAIPAALVVQAFYLLEGAVRRLLGRGPR